MKKFNYFSLVALLLIASCKASEGTSVSWRPDGYVNNSEGKEQRLEITGVFDSLNYEGTTYLTGFKIDKDGINYPQIASIDSSVSKVVYWQVEKIPSDLFLYKNSVHFTDVDGDVYQLVSGTWQQTDMHFPPESQIVYSDNHTELVVCYPASPVKSTVRKSGCKSLTKKWQQEFVWITQLPNICNNLLYAVEEMSNPKVLRKIDMETGIVKESRNVKGEFDDLCKL